MFEGDCYITNSDNLSDKQLFFIKQQLQNIADIFGLTIVFEDTANAIRVNVVENYF
jgi:hypothetical protein